MDFQTNSFFKNRAYVRYIQCMSNIEGSWFWQILLFIYTILINTAVCKLLYTDVCRPTEYEIDNSVNKM